ncbi:Neurol pentraxin receptor [Daphnia sinensis]|uniref:Neurol pentraxin receptor n=1 Tax=Daphnia sinensis TaxID=1820382 RepID=A0AAD5PUT6_9CRUS|nr:Neurol pentraxin receptor [Daphnia sinensis]
MRSLIILASCIAPIASLSPTKVILTQRTRDDRRTIQLVEFLTTVPNLQDFTVCYWLKSVNTTTRQSTFSYAAPNDPVAIATWIEPTIFGLQIRMALSGKEVYSVAYNIAYHHWYHLCHSWEGASGRWLLYVDGELIGQGFDSTAQPLLIPGGGTVVFGQQQNNFDLGPERPGGFQSSAGVEGEMTLMFFDSRPLRHEVESLGASGNIKGEILGSKLTSDIERNVWDVKPGSVDCFNQPQGDIVAWGITQFELMGGALMVDAKPSCGDF